MESSWPGALVVLAPKGCRIRIQSCPSLYQVGVVPRALWLSPSLEVGISSRSSKEVTQRTREGRQSWHWGPALPAVQWLLLAAPYTPQSLTHEGPCGPFCQPHCTTGWKARGSPAALLGNVSLG